MSHNMTVNSSIDNYNAYCLDQENTAKPYHGLIVYTYKNIKGFSVTKFQGKTQKQSSLPPKRVQKNSTLFALQLSHNKNTATACSNGLYTESKD